MRPFTPFPSKFSTIGNVPPFVWEGESIIVTFHSLSIYFLLLKVKLNVGGKWFVTTEDTLMRDPNCYFASLFRGNYVSLGRFFYIFLIFYTFRVDHSLISFFYLPVKYGKYKRESEEKNSFFIDRDPTHFRYILNYLRNGFIHVSDDISIQARE